MLNILQPLIKEIHNKKLWGFDIETYGDKNKFTLCSIIGDDGINAVFQDKQNFIDFLDNKKALFRHGYICATNLGFDLTGVLSDTELISKLQPIFRGGNMISGVIKFDKYRKLRFIDTMNFCNFSVKKWGEILGIRKLPQPICFFRKPKTHDELQELRAYNLRDSEITYSAMKFLQAGFNKLGCNLKMTVASTAMDLFKRKYLKKPLFQPPRDKLTEHYLGYYGGRCEVIKRGRVKNLNKYDVNSLYPSVMVKAYPHPNFIRYTNIVTDNLIQKYEGLCKVKLQCPEMYIPYLPVKYLSKNSVKLIFPCGIISGYYTFHELRKAMELGYKIKRYYSAIFYTKSFYPFKEYVEALYKERLIRQKQNDNTEIILKLMLNSLYGKWAQKIDNNELILHKDSVTYEMIDSSDNFYQSGDFFIFNQDVMYIPKFINPIFSIYTTAYARTELYDLIQKSEKGIYYYDTDSLITKHEYPTSLKLGSLKNEGFIKDGIIIKPKMYIFDNQAKCKGVNNLTPELFQNIIHCGFADITRFSKFKESNRRKLGFNELIRMRKHIDLNDDKRAWQDKFNPEILQESLALSI